MAHSPKFDRSGTSILVSHFNQNLDPAHKQDQSRPEGRNQEHGATNGGNGNGNGHGSAPLVAGSNREQVMIEFQQSMLAITRSFLEAQQQVMMAYLGSPVGGHVNQPPDFSHPAHGQGAAEASVQYQGQHQRQVPAHNQANPTLLEYPVAPVYASPLPGAYGQPAPAASFEQVQAGPDLYQAVPEGYQPAPEQYQPQAVGSIAPAQPSVPSPERPADYSADAALTPVAQPPVVSETDAPALSAEALVETLIDIVSDRTGYPKEMLDPTLDMEADLGIDSIKKIEILNALRKLLPVAKQAQIEESMERIATIKTLAGVMDWIRDEFGDQAAAPGAEASSPSAASSPSVVAPSGAPETTPSSPSAVAPSGAPAPQVANALSESAQSAASVFSSSPAPIKPRARLNGCAVSHPEAGVVAFTVAFGPENDLYLNDHKFNQVPVMPMAVALELMAEAACSVYPGYSLSSVENLDIPAGITFEGGAKELTVVVRNRQGTTNGAQSDHVGVSTAVTTGGANGRVHFKAKIELTRSLNGRNGASSEALAEFPALRNPERRLPTVDEIYGKLMFHGPLMQGICQVTELGEDGISGVLRSSDIKSCVASANGDNWIIDPILLDSAMQLAGIWARHYHDIMVLPTGFTRLRLYKNGADSGSFANLTGKIHVPVEYDKGQLLCDLAIYSDGKPVMTVEGLGGVGSKSFNKLAAQS